MKLNQLILLIFATTNSSFAWSPDDFEMPSNAQIRNKLTALSYQITQLGQTERPYTSNLVNEKREGIYVDVVSGEPLFLSEDKYDSGTGWPSFSNVLNPDTLIESRDTSNGMIRTEVRSRFSGSHLGHLFMDGPKPTGKRYCINGAALRFIPFEELIAEDYLELLPLFPKILEEIKLGVAAFAGGCFWTTESDFRKLDGILGVRVGFTAGKASYPTYKSVVNGGTGHVEAALIFYEPTIITYSELAEYFFKHIDPTSKNKQFYDIGTNYQTVLFYKGAKEKSTALATKQKIATSGNFSVPILTEIKERSNFFPAGKYHQNYASTHSYEYNRYRKATGRDAFLSRIWD